MAKVLYEGLRTLPTFSICWPDAQRDNWLDFQADYCAQHVGEPHSVAFVTTDEDGAMTGMAYGRFLDGNTAPAWSGLTVTGCNVDELDKMDDSKFQKTLIEKYGGVL